MDRKIEDFGGGGGEIPLEDQDLPDPFSPSPLQETTTRQMTTSAEPDKEVVCPRERCCDTHRAAICDRDRLRPSD